MHPSNRYEGQAGMQGSTVFIWQTTVHCAVMLILVLVLVLVGPVHCVAR